MIKIRLMYLFLVATLPWLAACSASGSASLELAARLERERDFAAAAIAYRAATMEENAPAQAYVGLANSYRKIGKSAEAVALLRDAKERWPDEAKVLNALGLALIDTQQAEEAVELFDALIAFDPKNALYHNGKAVAFDHAGNHVAAQEIYHEALLLDPDSAIIRNNLALSLMLSGQAREAALLLEPLAAKDDAREAVRRNLALAYSLTGRRDRAVAIGVSGLSKQEAEAQLRLYQRARRANR